MHLYDDIGNASSSLRGLTSKGGFTPKASVRFHQFGASVRRILFNIMHVKRAIAFTHNASVCLSGESSRGLIFGRFISTRSSDFTCGKGCKLAYFKVKFDHIRLQNINLLI